MLGAVSLLVTRHILPRGKLFRVQCAGAIKVYRLQPHTAAYLRQLAPNDRNGEKMILSRAKPASSEGVRTSVSHKEIPKLDEFLEKRDYTGALTLLEFNNTTSGTTIYENLRNKDYVPSDISTNLACCYFYLGMYSESQKILEEAENSKLRTRLLFHLAHKMGNESKLMEYHQMLQDIIEDQLSLASIHYLQAHYQEAIDVYKKILLDNRDYLALNVYVALCYYKLDYYDVAQEVLQVYLQKYPDSTIAINLKACNHFRLYDGNAAQVEMKQLVEKISSSFSSGHDLIRHNTVVCVSACRELLSEVIQILKNTSNSQVEQIIRVMRKWGKENRVNC
ncbi:Tetratricopeptide repeat protein 26 [Trachymyrmex zeteki]|uniref:Intraflagellar transport protein 56 n=1 Tax=Mycetomoellerius zeteki TaxID=64791 RepID=A0A151WI44_9HYME|nr:Tetratricopeptide repeat protein 26 [Trachymyrmex zeteki]